MSMKKPERVSTAKEASSRGRTSVRTRRLVTTGHGVDPGWSWQLILCQILFGRPKDNDSVIAALRKGLSVSNLERVRERLGVSERDILALLGSSVRTYQRRKAQRQNLGLLISDRLYRLAKVQAMAASVFESYTTAADWLKRPNRALGDSPLNLLDTDVGADMVERLLTRVEHGVYS